MKLNDSAIEIFNLQLSSVKKKQVLTRAEIDAVRIRRTKLQLQ